MGIPVEFPVLTKEMRSQTRGWKRWLHHAIVVAPFLFFVSVTFLTWGGEGSVSPVATLVLVECTTMLLLVPAFAGGAIAREHEQHTIADLLFTPLPSWQIVTGKWLSALVSVLFMTAGVLPLAGVWAFLGESILPILAAQGIILLAAGFVAAYSLYLSTFFRRLTNATATAYGIALGTILFPPLLQYAYFTMWIPFEMIAIWERLGFVGSCMTMTVVVVWLMSVLVRFFAHRMPSQSFLITSHIVCFTGCLLLGIFLGYIVPLWIMGNPFGVLTYLLRDTHEAMYIICCDLDAPTVLTGVAAQLLLIPMLLHLTVMRIEGMRENRQVKELIR